MKHSALQATCQIFLLAISLGMSPRVTQAKAVIPRRVALTPSLGAVVLKLGSVGSEVKDVQSMLALMGYYTGPVDGNYTQATLQAVRQFQTEAGLNADGVVGPLTWQSLLPSVATLAEPVQPNNILETTSVRNISNPVRTSDSASVETLESFPVLVFEDRGPDVERLQERLAALNLYDGPLDGVFGLNTEQAVKNFQSQAGLTVDGIVGPATWQGLMK
ncbi:MAG: peptidoglycan-binding protein [Cyanobacteria bacterium P01_D01_bin.156]